MCLSSDVICAWKGRVEQLNIRIHVSLTLWAEPPCGYERLVIQQEEQQPQVRRRIFVRSNLGGLFARARLENPQGRLAELPPALTKLTHSGLARWGKQVDVIRLEEIPPLDPRVRQRP
ncbi:hypothetical protein BE04_37685 [Sorangium cellulosum]|uniref:Uncharacterized protein n=1 Tax=Sorangium cellulosum TaxID=56 RepID=A0A150P0V1_SORCE|nr:hypothetical protein BE04_37685 [Sorangium cellulosum]